jgi:hypothetical protein
VFPVAAVKPPVFAAVATSAEGAATASAATPPAEPGVAFVTSEIVELRPFPESIPEPFALKRIVSAAVFATGTKRVPYLNDEAEYDFFEPALCAVPPMPTVVAVAAPAAERSIDSFAFGTVVKPAASFRSTLTKPEVVAVAAADAAKVDLNGVKVAVVGVPAVVIVIVVDGAPAVYEV